VHIAYTDYISGLIQKPRIYQLLPFSKPDVISSEPGTPTSYQLPTTSSDYLFEPNPQAVLDRVLPRLVETMLYQALLESSASEHSARMLAMRSASDAAKDMLTDLKFTYNQIRQSTITREIAEISSGKAAIE
jgi:F-type H+-transporting ATPase subunit gamma